jgi:uncharacterized RDD family membrane protein YckC
MSRDILRSMNLPGGTIAGRLSPRSGERALPERSISAMVIDVVKKERAPSPVTNDEREVALGLAVFGARAAAKAGRFAVGSLRAVTRAPIVGPPLRRAEDALAARGREAEVKGRAKATEVAEQEIDRALAGPLPDSVARSAAEHNVVERIGQEVLTTKEFEEAVATALESRLTAELATRVLTHQTRSFADDVVDAIRSRLGRFDDRISRGLPAPGYGGLTVRGAAFAVDFVLAQLIVLLIAAILAIVSAIVGRFFSGWEAGAALGGSSFIALGIYLVTFWTLTGQTPGMNLMGVRVTDSTGNTPGLVRSLARLVGLALAIIPLFAGFLPILFDRKRRALQDFLAQTVVVKGDEEPGEVHIAGHPGQVTVGHPAV